MQSLPKHTREAAVHAWAAVWREIVKMVDSPHATPLNVTTCHVQPSEPAHLIDTCSPIGNIGSTKPSRT